MLRPIKLPLSAFQGCQPKWVKLLTKSWLKSITHSAFGWICKPYLCRLLTCALEAALGLNSGKMRALIFSAEKNDYRKHCCHRYSDARGRQPRCGGVPRVDRF